MKNSTSYCRKGLIEGFRRSRHCGNVYNWLSISCFRLLASLPYMSISSLHEEPILLCWTSLWDGSHSSDCKSAAYRCCPPRCPGSPEPVTETAL